MMRAIQFTVCFALLMLVFRPVSAAEGSAETLSVRIVSTSIREDGRRTITLSPHFDVVVTNQGTKPIRLWREWCSWGYFALSFEARDPDSVIQKVTKRPMYWDKNYPDFTTLPPGDHMVFEVAFDSATWQGAPLPSPGAERRVRLKAVFEIRGDEETRKFGVWTGRISSQEDEYTFYR